MRLHVGLACDVMIGMPTEVVLEQGQRHAERQDHHGGDPGRIQPGAQAKGQEDQNQAQHAGQEVGQLDQDDRRPLGQQQEAVGDGRRRRRDHQHDPGGQGEDGAGQRGRGQASGPQFAHKPHEAERPDEESGRI